MTSAAGRVGTHTDSLRRLLPASNCNGTKRHAPAVERGVVRRAPAGSADGTRVLLGRVAARVEEKPHLGIQLRLNTENKQRHPEETKHKTRKTSLKHMAIND